MDEQRLGVHKSMAAVQAANIDDDDCPGIGIASGHAGLLKGARNIPGRVPR